MKIENYCYEYFKLYNCPFHLNDNIVCEMSKDKNEHIDFHDYIDSNLKEPWHFYKHTCERCGKRFYI